MEQSASDRLIADAAKTLFSYCRARTGGKEEAEDLSQDILLELLRTRGNLRDDKAFYGFMWAVAGNVYKNWCKKRARAVTAELDDEITDDAPPLQELLESETDLRLLRRELGLLGEQYRKVTVMYYFDGRRVSEISDALDITESMVKFLLFKSRKILKEGMNMTRTNGELSYNPGNLRLSILSPIVGGNPYPFWELVNRNLIAQNILLACYNDRCSAEEISLQIGVAVPYLEKDLKELCEKGLLAQKSGKYETAIIIMTKEFLEEADEKTLPTQSETAAVIGKFLNERLNDIKAIGFHIGTEDDNLLKWHIAAIILRHVIWGETPKLSSTRKYGDNFEGWIWGVQPYPSESGGMRILYLSNPNGDKINALDLFFNGCGCDCEYFVHYSNRVNIALDIARGKSDGFSENDMAEVAEFIKNGFVQKTGDSLSLRLPVLTAEQYSKLLSLFDCIKEPLVEQARKVIDITTDILAQHSPVSLKKEAETLKGLRRTECVVMPAKIMLDNGVLQRPADNSHPTAYVVLK